MFFNVGSTFSEMLGKAGPLLEVQSDGKKHVVYSLPPGINPTEGFAWTVTPVGAFYVLYSDSKTYKLVRFKSDGSVDETISLDIPPNVFVEHMAISDKEITYVDGYRETNKPGERTLPGFAALLNASGKVVHDLSSGTSEFDLNAAAQHPVDGDAVAGEDGRFYVLGSTGVSVFNQSGEAERKLKFEKPPGSYAVRLDYSKGLLSIMFVSFHADSQVPRQTILDPDIRTLLLNAITGESQGTFVFNPATTGNILCFTAQDGYSLMAVDGKLAAKDIVPIR
jgi:hypothetical protein